MTPEALSLLAPAALWLRGTFSTGRVMLLLLLGSQLRSRVPVPEHLYGQYNIQGEATEETIEDKRIINLGQSGEDSRKGAEKVIEDLISAQASLVPSFPTLN